MIDHSCMNRRRRVPGFYMGPQNFPTGCFYALIAKGLFINILWKLLPQPLSKTIDTNTLYKQRGIVWYIYVHNRQVGCIFYLCAKVCTPCAPWGTKSPKGTWYQDEALEMKREVGKVWVIYMLSLYIELCTVLVQPKVLGTALSYLANIHSARA